MKSWERRPNGTDAISVLPRAQSRPSSFASVMVLPPPPRDDLIRLAVKDKQRADVVDFATCDTLHNFLHNPRLWRLTCGIVGDFFDCMW